jgi:hypothetical protein
MWTMRLRSTGSLTGLREPSEVQDILGSKGCEDEEAVMAV